MQVKIYGFTLTDNPFGASIKHHITTQRDNPLLDLKLHIDNDTDILLYKEPTPFPPSARTPKWNNRT